MYPATLYKYLCPERVDVLQNLNIRFTQVSALNDPFESFPGVMLAGREWYRHEFNARVEAEIEQRGIKSVSKKKQHRRARRKEFEPFLKCHTDRKWLTELSETVQHMSDTVQGCLSLSATPVNILMWSHYARHHTGYVIGFHGEHEYFGTSVHPVTYSPTRPPHNPFAHRHSGDLFYTKSPDWNYEQEYRKYQSFVEPITLANGNYLSPYTEPASPKGANSAVILFPLPGDSIQCVILGWKSARELREKVVLALEAHHLADTPIYKATPSLTKYEMEIVRDDEAT